MSDIIAYKLNGEIVDTQSIEDNVNSAEPVYFDNSKEALNVIRHSCAHLMAEAIKSIYPEAKFFVGPAIEDGFYYDFRVDEAGTKLGEADLEAIEAKMKELVEAKKDIVKTCFSKKEISERFKDDDLKQEVLKRIPDGPVSMYSQGIFEDIC
ncbi:threonine--tRNA ligase, partial [Campylobacter sp. MOP51]